MTKVFYTTYKDEKKQSQAGRALLDFVLREYYNIKCYTLSMGDNGKPYVDGDPVFFNISHSGGIAVVAVSDGPVGIDTEPMRSIRPRVIERYIGIRPASPEEALLLWLQRESYGKMTGEGFAVSEPSVPHVFHHFEVIKDGGTHYICVCTAADEVCLRPCSVPLT